MGEKAANDQVLTEQLAFYKRVSESRLPLFSGREGILIWEKVKPRLPKVVVITIPRSGTHFTSKLLHEMGMVFAGLHVAPSLEPDLLQDRRSMQINPDGQLYWRDYRLHLADVFKLLGPGQYIQGHVPHQPDLVAALSDCKIIYARRNLRDVAVSAMRFICKLKASGTLYPPSLNMRWCELDDSPAKMLGYLKTFGDGLPVLKKSIEPWKDEPNTFVLDFDTLTGADSDAAQTILVQLAAFLNLPNDLKKLTQALKKSMGSDTPSWSGKLSRWNDVWNDEVEALFQRRLAGESIEADLEPADLPEANDAPAKTDPEAKIVWLHAGSLTSKHIKVGDGAPVADVTGEILPERVQAQDQLQQLDLLEMRQNWAVEGAQIDVQEHWVSIGNLDGYKEHRHLTIPIAVTEALTMVTFSLVLDLEKGSRHLVLQAGSENGFFNSTIDGAAASVRQIQYFGDCRSLCTRIDPVKEGQIKVSMAGLLGVGTQYYVWIYLCDSDGNMDFAGQLQLRVTQLALSYGLDVFKFN